jgi:polyisoprenoid-binding protein YceI
MIRGLLLPLSLLGRPLSGLPLLGLALALVLAATPARAERFAIDPVHTRIAFQVSHAGFSWPVGSFSGASGVLDFDRADWSQARVEVKFPVSSLELGNADWQGKILDPTFFDAKQFPEARFASTKVEPTGSDTADVTGNLSLHGVTRPVLLHVKLNALARHPMTLRRTAGFSATGTLSRKDFGMDHWSKVVGDEVRLILEVEATRDRDAGGEEKHD